MVRARCSSAIVGSSMGRRPNWGVVSNCVSPVALADHALNGHIALQERSKLLGGDWREAGLYRIGAGLAGRMTAQMNKSTECEIWSRFGGYLGFSFTHLAASDLCG